LDYLTPRDVIKACAKHGITTLAAVPPLWVQLAEQEWPPEATENMRRLTNSGGALTPSLVKMLRSIFRNKTQIFAMYGLTEAFRSTFLDPALIDANPTSMGRAIPFAEISVVAPDGNEAEPNQPGELVHAGPLVAQGYWQDEARTAERFKPAPGFSKYGGMAVWSGDTVRRDADGLLYFVGRDDAMIKTSGNRVSPTEIEEAAVESGLVAEACALGRKDERLGAAIVLFARGSGDDDGLKAHLKATLPNFMQPAEIIWLEAFPKSANGKLDRNVLAERVA
jgi:acyl-CoA synthetase (AMP-forming)/AMP-acid ligase II